MAYVRKTKDEYWLMGDYGNGWDFILAEETLVTAKKQKKTYMKEDRFVKDLKIVKKRIPILHEYYIYKLKTNSKEFCCRIKAKDKLSALREYKKSLLSSGEYWIEGEILYSSYGARWCVYEVDKLKEYGFSDYAIENLMKGKVVIVAYGKVKYNVKNGKLTTYYTDGTIKEEILLEENQND